MTDQTSKNDTRANVMELQIYLRRIAPRRRKPCGLSSRNLTCR